MAGVTPARTPANRWIERWMNRTVRKGLDQGMSSNAEPRFKSVLIVDQAMGSGGTLANVALVVGLTVGRELPQETFGPDVTDGEGAQHRYLTRIGHIVRKAGQSKMRSLRKAAAEAPRVLVVDYTEDAAPTDYDEYSRQLAGHSGEEIRYRALYIYGPEETVVPLTKSLSRLA